MHSQSDEEVEGTLRAILTPDGYPSIQVQALRRDIIRRLQEELKREQEEQDLLDYKRSLSAWARWGDLADKRNLEALARGGYIKTRPGNHEESGLKRSRIDLDGLKFQKEGKRGIQSLARNGELPTPRRRDAQEARDEGYDKRNDGAYDTIPYDQRYFENMNAEALKMEANRNADDKRNIGSIKAQFKPKFKRSAGAERSKRQIDYYDMVNEEYPSPVYQNQNVYDYEELINQLTGSYPNTEKRFLGKFFLYIFFCSIMCTLHVELQLQTKLLKSFKKHKACIKNINVVKTQSMYLFSFFLYNFPQCHFYMQTAIFYAIHHVFSYIFPKHLSHYC